ncbi:tripartite tricarboxylate transporter substrate binding protein [Reyranella sp.]|uniref:Bug family tripartite tricarboxylate transporter substrate binding protein n=1 Tax=Reyranella sp. TaxID=1929291 RepID=UPI00122B6F01|nr:tripartite tricarboxylate transporter substrate-binding protein [Reyranella sp.]TAJ87318.1 MAG: tripartite tricarboxylate transporter substrate binding protein [Reyranella sp.]
MSSLSRRHLMAASAAAVLVAPSLARAQGAAPAWPAKQIRMIAPYPPGGGVDTVTRAFSDKVGPKIGQAIVVDNQPGAGGVLGGAALARSPNDGYTLMVGSLVDYSIAPFFHQGLTFDMAKDFVPILEIANGTIAVLVTPSLPVKNVQELIALAKSKPGQLSYASSGFGGLIHLNYEMLKQITGAEMTHVPYKGTTQFQADLYEGRVQVSIDNVLAHLPHIASGKVRCLAVTSKNRSPLLPDAPTMAEAGVPGSESATNYTLFAPKGIAPEIVARLNASGNEVVKDPEFRERMLKLGIVPVGSTQPEVQAKLTSEMKRWGDVIQKGNIKPS